MATSSSVVPRQSNEHAVLPIINGKDVIAQGQYGSGRSAISDAVCQRIDIKDEHPQALFLSPTRELAAQAKKEILAVGQFKHINAYAHIGGEKDIIKPKEAHLVLGTPSGVGRMLDDRMFHPTTIKVLILDDCDEMLSRGFKDEIYRIYVTIPAKVQVVLISATLTKEVLEMESMIMTDPVRILVEPDELVREGIKQYFVAFVKDVKDVWKFDTLLGLYETISMPKVVIFCKSKRKVNQLTGKLRSKEFRAWPLHGDMSEEKRNAGVEKFNSAVRGVLISTDVLEGYCAVIQVDRVINYDLPTDPALYIRRIGRVACFYEGADAVIINFVRKGHKALLRRIERRYSTKIRKMPKKVL